MGKRDDATVQRATGPRWREQYEAWHRALPDDAAPDTPWHRLVCRYLDPARDVARRTVLEVACGRGGFARWLAGRAPAPTQVVAVDVAATALCRAASGGSGATRIGWVQADIEQLPFAGERFDTVISCETLEHVPHPASAVRQLARVLKPGGRLFLTVPNYLGPMGLYRAYLRLTGRRYRESGQPLNRVTVLPRVCWWIRRSGLIVERVDAVGHYCPWPGRPPIALEGPLARIWPWWTALHGLVVARKPDVP